jgi:hypothetical protein
VTLPCDYYESASLWWLWGIIGVVALAIILTGIGFGIYYFANQPGIPTRSVA